MQLPDPKTCTMFHKIERSRNEIDGYRELYEITHNEKVKTLGIKAIDRALHNKDLMWMLRAYDYALYLSYAFGLVRLRDRIEKDGEIE